MSARLRALCDALGNLLKFALMPGQRHDSKGVEEMIRNPKFEALLADKAFDVQWLIERLQAQGVPIVTSQRPNRRQPLSIDEHRYRWPHLNSLASLGQNLAQASATAFTEALKSPGKKHEAKRSFRKNA